MRRFWMVLIGIGLGANTPVLATLAFTEPGMPSAFFWMDRGQVHYRKCTVLPFTEAELAAFTTKILPQCEKDPNKTSYPSVSERAYATSLGALYGVPTRFFDGSPETAVADVFLRQEREFRQGSESGETVQAASQFFFAYEQILEPLLFESSQIISSKDEESVALRFNARAAFASLFSDGRTAVVLGKSVGPAQVFSACSEGWGVMSLDTANDLLARDGARLQKWYAQSNPKVKGMVMTWHETFTEKPVRNGGGTALKRELSTPYLNLATKGTSATGNYLYPTLCIRREFYRARSGRPFKANGTLTLTEIARSYNLEPGVFYTKLLKRPLLESVFSDFHLSERLMPEAELKRIRPELDALLGRGSRDWDTAEATAIAEERRHAQQQAEAARIAAAEAQAAKQRQAQLAWEREQAQIRAKQAAEQREREYQEKLAAAERERNSRPLYARYTHAASTYTDHRNYPISKAEHDRQMNKYNEATYGRRYLDASGNPVSKEDYENLNIRPERTTTTYRQSTTRQVRVILVPSFYYIP